MPGPIADIASSGPDVSAAYFEDEPAYDQDDELFEDDLDYALEAQARSGTGAARPAVYPPVRLKPRRRWGRIIVLGSLLLAAGAALLYLTLYLSKGRPTPALGVNTEPEELGRFASSQVASVPAPNYPPGDSARGVKEVASSGAGAQNVAEHQDIVTVIEEPSTLQQEIALASDSHASDAELEPYVDTAVEGDEIASTSILSSDEPESLPADLSDNHMLETEHTFLVNFSFDSDDLIPDSHHLLDSAVVMLKANPASVASITGFTDNQGDKQYNLTLSRKRAEAVQQYLVNAGIAQERLSVEGRGALTNPEIKSEPESEDAMEPFRIVQIKIAAAGSL